MNCLVCSFLISQESLPNVQGLEHTFHLIFYCFRWKDKSSCYSVLVRMEGMYLAF